MRLIVNLAAMVFSAVPSFVPAQAEPPALWSQTYGSLDDEVASHVIVQSDGSIAVNAQKTIYKDATRNLLKSQSDAWLFGLTRRGELIWDQTNGGTGSDTFYVAAEGPELGLLLCGLTDSNVDNIGIWAASADAEGRIQHQNVIPGMDDIAATGGVSTNGQLYVCGQEWAGVQKKWQAFVLALTEDFDVDWKLSVGDKDFDSMQQIVLIGDGKLLAMGRIGTASGFDDLLMLLNSDGKEIWRRVIPREDGQYRSTVVATRDGGFLTLGRKQNGTRNSPWIQKFDASAKPQWEKQIRSNHDDSGTNATVLSDGSFLVAGSRESAFPDRRRKFNAILVKLASDGTLQWRRSFPVDGHSHIHAMAQQANGQIVGVGAKMPANTKNSDAWVFTFTPSGEFPASIVVKSE